MMPQHSQCPFVAVVVAAAVVAAAVVVAVVVEGGDGAAVVAAVQHSHQLHHRYKQKHLRVNTSGKHLIHSQTSCRKILHKNPTELALKITRKVNQHTVSA